MIGDARSVVKASLRPNDAVARPRPLVDGAARGRGSPQNGLLAAPGLRFG